MNTPNYELKRITDELDDLMKKMFYGYVTSGPFVLDPDELLDEWSPPDDDRVVDILVEAFRTPPDYVLKNGGIDYWEDMVVSEVFSKAVGSSTTRTAKCRQFATTPSVRPLITISLSSIRGEERNLLRDDLIGQMKNMSAQEIDCLIEDILLENYQNTGYQHVLALLKRSPTHYKPYPAYLLGKLPTWREAQEGRVRD